MEDGLATKTRIDEIATRFEKGWEFEQGAHLGTYYQQFPNPKLLVELISIDVELSFNIGEERELEDYIGYLPGVPRSLIAEGYTAAIKFLQESKKGTTPSQVNKPLALPCQFGKFELVEVLGDSGYATIYLAKQVFPNRLLALKVLHRATSDDRVLSRFRTEAQAIAELDHPNIVPLYESGTIDEASYIAMRYVPGRNLRELIVDGPLSPRLAASYIRTAAKAIGHAHSKGVLHRDIKAENILLDRDGSIQVIDFGLALLQSSDQSLTKTGEILGTIYSMPPEQTSPETGSVDERSDVYSLGATLYFLLTASVPFRGISDRESIRMIEEDDPLAPSRIVGGTPRDLDTIVLKCLEKTQADRYQTAEELAEELQRFLENEPILARPASSFERIAKWCRRKPYLAGLVASLAGIFLLVFFSLLVVWRGYLLEKELTAQKTIQSQILQENAEQERRLRLAADLAAKQAKNALKTSEIHEIASEVKAAKFAMDSGRYFSANQSIDSMASSSASFEKAWLRKHANVAKETLAHFSTADYGLYDACLSPEKSRLLVVTQSGKVAIWDLASGDLIQEIKGGAWSADFQRFYPRRVYQTRRERFDKDFVFASSAFWLDADQIIYSHFDGSVFLFDLQAGKREKLFQSSEEIYVVRKVENDPHRLLVFGSKGRITMRALSGEVEKTFELKNSPSAVAEIPGSNGGWVVGDDKGELVLLDSDLTFQSRVKLPGPAYYLAPQASRGQLFLSVATSNKLLLWEIVTSEDGSLRKLALRKETNKVPSESGKSIRCALADADGKRLFGIDSQNRLVSWDMGTGQRFFRIMLGPTKDIRQPNAEEKSKLKLFDLRQRAFIFKSGNRLVAIDCFGTVKVFSSSAFRVSDPWQFSQINLGDSPVIRADSNIPGRLWGLNRNGELVVVDLSKSKPVDMKRAHEGGRNDIQVRSDGRVVTVGGDNFLKVWRFNRGKIELVRQLESDLPLLSVAVHEAKDLVGACDATGRIRIWKFSDFSHIATLGFPSANSLTNSLEDKFIQTGRLAFSRSGKFVGAFGRRQCFEVFDTSTWQRVELVDDNIAGNGGTAIHFSPTTEGSFMVSSTIVYSKNRVAISDAVSQNSPHGRFQPIVDFSQTRDGKRIVGLFRDGNLDLFSADSFIFVSNIPVPLEKCHSVTVGAFDFYIAVASETGELAWTSASGWNANNAIEFVVEGKAKTFLPAEGKRFFVTNYSHKLSMLDGQGQLAAVVCESTSEEKKMQDTTAYLLRQIGEQWSLKQVEFEGRGRGPILDASLSLDRAGLLAIFFRQGVRELGNYQGRLVALRQVANGWNVEEIKPDGNQGFAAIPFFNAQNRLAKVLHTCLMYQRLMISEKHERTGEWRHRTLRGAVGARTSPVFDAKGNGWFLSQRLHGWGSSAPPLLIKMDLEWDKTHFFEGVGSQLLIDSKDNIVSFNDRNRQFCRFDKANEQWRQFTVSPLIFGTDVSSPVFDSSDRIWQAEVGSNNLFIHCYEDKQWRSGLIQLKEQQFDTGHPLLQVNAEGKMQIVVVGRNSVTAIEAKIPERHQQ